MHGSAANGLPRLRNAAESHNDRPRRIVRGTQSADRPHGHGIVLGEHAVEWRVLAQDIPHFRKGEVPAAVCLKRFFCVFRDAVSLGCDARAGLDLRALILPSFSASTRDK